EVGKALTVDQLVRKSRITTGFTTGVVTDPSTTVEFRGVLWVDQFLVEGLENPFGDYGDSGSAVISMPTPPLNSPELPVFPLGWTAAPNPKAAWSRIRCGLE